MRIETTTELDQLFAEWDDLIPEIEIESPSGLYELAYLVAVYTDGRFEALVENEEQPRWFNLSECKVSELEKP